MLGILYAFIPFSASAVLLLFLAVALFWHSARKGCALQRLYALRRRAEEEEGLLRRAAAARSAFSSRRCCAPFAGWCGRRHQWRRDDAALGHSSRWRSLRGLASENPFWLCGAGMGALANATCLAAGKHGTSRPPSARTAFGATGWRRSNAASTSYRAPLVPFGVAPNSTVRAT